MSSSFRLPKSFKPAVLDSSTVESETLNSKKQQLWHFTFPADFNVAAFSELELHLPAEPISSATQSAQHVASFELDGNSYRIIEGSVYETSDIVNLFPSAEEPGSFELGKPFTRCFRICREVVFPAPAKSIPVNPRGRAPNQLQGMKKNFFPIGYVNEALKEEWKNDARQGRVLRSTSSRPESPRLLPNHGFELKEWRPEAFPPSGRSGSKKSLIKESSSSKADKKEKKAAKRAAESAALDANPTPSKKVKAEDEDEGTKKKKEKKAKKEKN